MSASPLDGSLRTFNSWNSRVTFISTCVFLPMWTGDWRGTSKHTCSSPVWWLCAHAAQKIPLWRCWCNFLLSGTPSVSLLCPYCQTSCGNRKHIMSPWNIEMVPKVLRGNLRLIMATFQIKTCGGLSAKPHLHQIPTRRRLWCVFGIYVLNWGVAK